jgi:hypothetical protein
MNRQSDFPESQRNAPSPASAGEIAKALCLFGIVILLISPERISWPAAFGWTLVQLAWIGGSGFCLLRLLALPLPSSLPDRLVWCLVSGWLTLPLYITGFLWLGYRWEAWLGIFLALAAGTILCAAMRKIGTSGSNAFHNWPTVPYWVYGAALLYVWLSIALPFGHFSPVSIFREFYSDGIQRFGTIHALSATLPPQNPFTADAPFRYYWFSFFPSAVELRFLGGDLFEIWKVRQTWLGFSLPVALWMLCASVFGRRQIAHAAFFFSYFFASFEVFFRFKSLPELISALGDNSPWWLAGQTLFSFLTTRDPDMLCGIVNICSDQLFMEDFLYIPQNAVALGLLLCSLWMWEAGRRWAALWALSLLAGFNGFFILPCWGAFLLLSLWQEGITAMILRGACLGSWSWLWMAWCGIVPGSFSGMVAAGAVCLLFLLAWRENHSAHRRQSRAIRKRDWDRGVAFSLLVAVVLIILLHPLVHPLVLLFNYAPALILGLAILVWTVQKRGRLEFFSGHQALFFLLAASAAQLAITFFLSWQHLPYLPGMLKEWAFQANDALNLFNHHHKAGKIGRLTWAILAGFSLIVWEKEIARFFWKRRLRQVGLGLGLAAAFLTSLLRPITYLQQGEVREGLAANYLLQHAGNTSRPPLVLLENFSESRLGLLAPARLYYYSSWAGGSQALTNRGSWAGQYVSASWKEKLEERERANRRFFSLLPAAQRQFLTANGIEYVLTQTLHPFPPELSLVVDSPGSYLYKVLVP